MTTWQRNVLAAVQNRPRVSGQGTRARIVRIADIDDGVQPTGNNRWHPTREDNALLVKAASRWPLESFSVMSAALGRVGVPWTMLPEGTRVALGEVLNMTVKEYDAWNPEAWVVALLLRVAPHRSYKTDPLTGAAIAIYLRLAALRLADAVRFREVLAALFVVLDAADPYYDMQTKAREEAEGYLATVLA